MPSRKTSRNGFDYATASYSDPRYARGGGAAAAGYATVSHYGGYAAYPYSQPYYGYPTTHPAYNGAYATGYVSRISIKMELILFSNVKAKINRQVNF